MLKDKIPEFDRFEFGEIRLLPYTITESIPIDPNDPETGHNEVETLMIKVTRRVSPLDANGVAIPYRVKDLVRRLRWDSLPASMKTCLTQMDTWTQQEKEDEEGV